MPKAPTTRGQRRGRAALLTTRARPVVAGLGASLATSVRVAAGTGAALGSTTVATAGGVSTASRGDDARGLFRARRLRLRSSAQAREPLSARVWRWAARPRGLRVAEPAPRWQERGRRRRHDRNRDRAPFLEQIAVAASEGFRSWRRKSHPRSRESSPVFRRLWPRCRTTCRRGRHDMFVLASGCRRFARVRAARRSRAALVIVGSLSLAIVEPRSPRHRSSAFERPLTRVPFERSAGICAGGSTNS